MLACSNETKWDWLLRRTWFIDFLLWKLNSGSQVQWTFFQSKTSHIHHMAIFSAIRDYYCNGKMRKLISHCYGVARARVHVRSLIIPFYRTYFNVYDQFSFLSPEWNTFDSLFTWGAREDGNERLQEWTHMGKKSARAPWHKIFKSENKIMNYRWRGEGFYICNWDFRTSNSLFK